MSAALFDSVDEAPATRPVVSSRLEAVDLLRGVAALGVLVCHAYGTPLAAAEGPLRWLAAPAEAGRHGVELFLVVSGFCIHMRCVRGVVGGRSFTIDFLSFWKRRMFRLYPPYLVAMGVSLVIGITYSVMSFVLQGKGQRLWPPAPYASTGDILLDVVVHLCMLQVVFLGFTLYNGPFWSLALEEQLYLLYTPFLWIRRRLGATRAVWAVMAVCLLWRCAGTPSVTSPWMVQGPSRWFEWCLGALAVEALYGLVVLPPVLYDLRAATVALAAALACKATSTTHACLVLAEPLFGIGFFIVLNAACRREVEGRPFGTLAGVLAKVGVWSYSLYLMHVPALSLGRGVLRALHLDHDLVLMHLLVPCFALGAGWVFHRLVERRFLRAG